MFKRHLQLALFLSLSWVAHAGASAGELTLFAREDMDGRQVTLREAVRNFNDIGFNDRASSMVVRSGRWEVCQHADFRGDCRIVEPGEYPNLASLGNNISSVREVQGRRDERRDDRRDDRRGDAGAPVLLFDGLNMRGRELPLRSDVTSLVDMGFNDATQSIVINQGSWEFCEHRDFGGACRVFGPGQYANLERTFHRSITSVRRVRDGGGRDDGGRGRRDDDRARRDGVELFATPGFGGDRIQVRDEVRSLVDANFNDRAGSVIVYSGQWEFCQHVEFRGQCTVFGPGRYDRLGALNNQISSVRRVR
ncbi:MAG TPA: beta/gamma crystallin-related protein [Telluria sp.]|jgi:hypothetical protein